jgi:hypothetical protein
MHCPHCGKSLPIQSSNPDSPTYPPVLWLFGFEFRSKGAFFGLPLLHVAFGYNPRTGLPRLACGIIAIGNFSFGLIAIGGIAAGGFVLSGIGLGLFALAGIAVGGVAVGGIAVGLSFALGGLALSHGHAIGGLPIILPPVN